MRHWMTRPKISRLDLRFLKCGVGLRDGLNLLAIAYLPTLGEFFQSICHILREDVLALLLALEYVALKGVWRSSSVASFASLSALSLPEMPQWLGHHDIETFRFSWFVSRGLMVWWNLRAKNCEVLGLGSVIAVMVAALSVKKAMWEMLGECNRYSSALVAPIDRAAISASKTSA